MLRCPSTKRGATFLLNLNLASSSVSVTLHKSPYAWLSLNGPDRSRNRQDLLPNSGIAFSFDHYHPPRGCVPQHLPTSKKRACIAHGLPSCDRGNPEGTKQIAVLPTAEIPAHIRQDCSQKTHRAPYSEYDESSRWATQSAHMLPKLVEFCGRESSSLEHRALPSLIRYARSQFFRQSILG